MYTALHVSKRSVKREAAAPLRSDSASQPCFKSVRLRLLIVLLPRHSCAYNTDLFPSHISHPISLSTMYSDLPPMERTKRSPPSPRTPPPDGTRLKPTALPPKPVRKITRAALVRMSSDSDSEDGFKSTAAAGPRSVVSPPSVACPQSVVCPVSISHQRQACRGYACPPASTCGFAITTCSQAAVLAPVKTRTAAGMTHQCVHYCRKHWCGPCKRAGGLGGG